MTRFLTGLLAMWLTAGGLAAQEYLPALYKVVGVAADDVLNVRAGPGASYDIVTSLPPDATGIEVAAVDPDTGWMLLNTPDQWSGYASPAYLERLPGQDDMGAFPLPLNCGGTEPFWGLSVGMDGSASYYDPETEEQDFILDWHGPAVARMGAEFGAVLSRKRDTIHLVLQRAECSDGMSDYAFGLKIDALVRTGQNDFMMTGCCALK